MKKLKVSLILSLLFILILSVGAISAENINQHDSQIIDGNSQSDCFIGEDALESNIQSDNYQNDKILGENELNDNGLESHDLNQNEESDTQISQSAVLNDENAGGDSEIANDMLYIRHIPETDESGRQIDAAKFIMITAAFEWEFRKIFPEGIKKSEKTVEIEDQAEKAIQELIDLSSGKLKKKYRFLKKLIRSDSLQDEVIYTGNQLGKVIDVFGKRLYELNNGTLNYTEMGQRLADQRNHYAHGDLDKDFIGESLSDVVFMRYVVYAIQLSRFGIDEKSIQHAINELFRCGILIN